MTPPLTAMPTSKQPLLPPLTKRHQEHLDFLQRVSQGADSLIAVETALLAGEAWNIVWKASGYALDVPSAATGPDGEMFYSWDNGAHHLELEIIPGKPAEFFYRNRITEEVWGEDYVIGRPLSSSVLKKFELVKSNA